MKYLAIVLFCAVAAFSLAPRTMSYQGVLRDAAGTVVPDGRYYMTFRLYRSAMGDTAIWLMSDSVTVVNGVFNTILRTLWPAFDTTYYLEVAMGSDTLKPRQQLTSTPYSLKASNAERVNSIEASRTAEPMKLLALDDQGKFPLSTIPADTARDGLDLPFADSAGGSVNALTITHGGTANAGAFYLRNAAGAGSAVFASSNGTGASVDARATGTGRAGHFQVLNTTNSRPAVDAYTTGTGQAGWFGVSNSSNSSPALESTTNGSGPAIKGTNTGTGRAGEFNGSVHLTGNLTKTYGASTFNISPVAFGIIDENGTIRKASPNVASCVYDTTDREFKVTFSGLTFNASDFITSVTCIGTFYTIPSTTGYFTTMGSEDGKLCVQIATPSGGGYIPAKRPFSFIIYQP